MKKVTSYYILTIIMVIGFLMYFFFEVLIPYYFDAKKIIRYDDVNLYINGEYSNLSDHYEYQVAAGKCEIYLPRYNEFEYKQYIKGFYIFDGLKTVSPNSGSFVLELQFDSIDVYNEFISYEYNRYKYSSAFDINYNNYECVITESEDLTYFRYKEDTPFQFGMLCKNVEELNVRYVYFIQCEFKVDKQFERVFKNTNCDW